MAGSTKKDDLIGSFEVRPFPVARIAGIDTVTMGRAKHHIPVLFEVDVTNAREAMRLLKAKTGESLSFTGWVIKCVAQAASEHKRAHAMRRGRRKLILFDDVDVGIVVHRQMAGSPSAETLPMPYLIRKANEKDLNQIHAELRKAQAAPLGTGEQIIESPRKGRVSPRTMRWFLRLPFFLRRMLVWNRLVKNPFYAKKTMGTVVVSSIGMFGTVGSGSSWAIPATLAALPVFMGEIALKPGVVGDRIEAREFLSMTVLFDHDVIDGVPIAVFLRRLRELLESAAFL